MAERFLAFRADWFLAGFAAARGQFRAMFGTVFAFGWLFLSGRRRFGFVAGYPQARRIGRGGRRWRRRRRHGCDCGRLRRWREMQSRGGDGGGYRRLVAQFFADQFIDIS